MLCFVVKSYIFKMPQTKYLLPRNFTCIICRRLCHFLYVLSLFTLIPYSRCDPQFLNLIEGEEAYLNYTYSCDIYDVFLQFGNRAPFYHSTDGGSLLLPPDQEHRFSIEIVNENNSCSLALTIYNVQKDDAGLYTCFVYEDVEKSQDYMQISVHVDYPPGKASCALDGFYQSGGWVSLQCVAQVGSMSGKIDCYQNGDKMPSLTGPFETNTSLKQTLLIKNSNIVYCCSATFSQPKPMCECSDTVIDPVYNRIHLGLTDLCSSTTSTQSSIFLSEIPMMASNKTGTTLYPIQQKTAKHLHYSIVVIWVLVFVILLLIVVFLAFIVVVYMYRARHTKDFTTVPCDENSVPCDENPNASQYIETPV